MEIRRLRDDEIGEVVRMWRRARDESQPWLEARMGHTEEDDLRFFRGTIARENGVWVAVESGDGGSGAVGNGGVESGVVGFLAIHGERLGWLYVDPVAQGRGIGTALLDKAKSLSPGGLTLHTHQRNARARAFYERRGFRAVRFGVSPPPENEPDVLYRFGSPRK